uniref:Transcriptional regulator n=1 Tax=Heterorhabditis bacteriophora TaxID=37862 RepID=A0A1I7WDG6_HETBA
MPSAGHLASRTAPPEGHCSRRADHAACRCTGFWSRASRRCTRFSCLVLCPRAVDPAQQRIPVADHALALGVQIGAFVGRQAGVDVGALELAELADLVVQLLQLADHALHVRRQMTNVTQRNVSRVENVLRRPADVAVGVLQRVAVSTILLSRPRFDDLRTDVVLGHTPSFGLLGFCLKLVATGTRKAPPTARPPSTIRPHSGNRFCARSGISA